MISLRGPKLNYLAVVLGMIAAFIGVYGVFFQARGFEKTAATIISIEETEASTADDKQYRATVEYTVNGKSYTSLLDTFSGSYKVGKTVTVLYDPKDPAIIHGSRGFYVYFLAVGVILTAGAVVSEVRRKRSIKEFEETRGETVYASSIQGEERELYFLTDLGTPKYGHRIEDRQRQVLYEAKMTKFTLTQPFGFDFIDHEHGVTAPHLVGHNEDSEWGSLLIDNHYTFELDGVDVWKHLKEHGVSVESSFDSGNGRVIGKNYVIQRDGAEIARAETTSQYPHEEDEAEHKLAAKLPAAGFFRIWTREQNLDLVFITLMAFARTGASDDKGGSYGAVLGTLKKLGKD